MVSVLALSVTYGDRLPLLSPAVTSSPGRGKSFLKGRGLGKEMKFAWTAKGSHFGGAGAKRLRGQARQRERCAFV